MPPAVNWPTRTKQLLKSSIITSLIAILTLCASTALQGQKITWSPAIEGPSNSYVLSVVGEDSVGNLFVVRARDHGDFSPKEHWIERYNSAMEMDFSTPLKLERKDLGVFRFEALKYIQGKLMLFTSFYNKASHRNTAYVAEMNAEGDVITDFKQLDEIVAVKLGNVGSFDFVVSQDSTKILIYHSEPYEKYKSEKFHYKVIDHHLNVLWEQQISLPYKSRDFEIVKYRIDAPGNVHLLSKVTDNEEKWVKGRPNFHYTMISYDWRKKQLQEYEVNLGEKSISDISFEFDAQGNIIAAGFYSNLARTLNNIAGTFYLKINPREGGVVNTDLRDFEQSFITEFIGERKAVKGKELLNYNIDHFIMTEDGGAIMVGEQVYKSVTCYSDPTTNIQTCDNNFYYNDLIIVKFSADGKTQWTRRIPKEQHSINDHGFFSSYLLAYAADVVHISFNENSYNFGIDEDRRRAMTSVRKAVAAHVTVSGDGTVAVNPLFKPGDQDIMLRPQAHRQTAPNSVIIFGQRKRHYRFGRWTF
jgi:hypothetical protein